MKHRTPIGDSRHDDAQATSFPDRSASIVSRWLYSILGNIGTVIDTEAALGIHSKGLTMQNKICYPAYLHTGLAGLLFQKAEKLEALASPCRLCPNQCGAHRKKGGVRQLQSGHQGSCGKCLAPLRRRSSAGWQRRFRDHILRFVQHGVRFLPELRDQPLYSRR